ncbi:MAG: Gfo/Idh/MocA family oxidoreductase [Bryobacteraceae bacterium]
MTRWLVAGIGDITTKRVIPAIEAEGRSEFAGVVTRDPAKASGYDCAVWTDFSEAVRDPGIDAVYVGTPVAMHAPQTIEALRAGKHVLCEKPMALSHAEATTMQAAAAETGRVLGIAYYRRMYPKVRRAMELLRRGAIGQPVLAEINCHSWRPGEDGLRGWLLDPAMSGGGPLFDIGSHRIDILNFLFGKPERVTGLVSNVVHAMAVEDAATVLIDYECGVRGVVDVRWHSRVNRDDFRIVGTEGALELSPLSGPGLRFPGGEESMACHTNVHYPCVENFVDALEGKAPLAATGATSVWTDWVTERAVRASAAAASGLGQR